MDIIKATNRFEKWMAQYTTLVRRDLCLKHQRMAESPFSFFRATFYRWMQLWPQLCPDLSQAPKILAVGDLHVENFGTWRDTEGRLVWGVNDFDEAAVLPYTVDLVRLATSASLAIDAGHLGLKIKDALTSILDGYQESLLEGGRPFVLEEENTWLRRIATNKLRDPVHFWQKLDSLPRWDRRIPPAAKRALECLLPEPGLAYQVFHRVAGLGSLGQVRLVAIAELHGGQIAREAKALRPSALYWATQKKAPAGLLYETIITSAVRCPDPYVRLRGSWIVRRLSPHCSRIELDVMPRDRDECRLLNAMGRETANIHLGTRKARGQIRRHLHRIEPNLLSSAVKDMALAVRKDWRAWREAEVEVSAGLRRPAARKSEKRSHG
jgi:hypothetical protein